MDETALGALISKPHSLQNLPVDGVIAMHFGQRNSIGSPHSIQNLASPGFSAWHFGHFILFSIKDPTRAS